ncbi:hypothetical protein GCM10027168_01340 [Streptomyces capparidis]
MERPARPRGLTRLLARLRARAGCRDCREREAGAGEPLTTESGDRVVRHRCERCGRQWSRPVEHDLDVHDIVRADTPRGPVYGEVRAVDGERIGIRDSETGRLLWVERWRVQVY